MHPFFSKNTINSESGRSVVGYPVPLGAGRSLTKFKMYKVYLLYSSSLKRFYVGQTNNLVNRLERHNTKQVKSTKPGVPWELVTSFSCASRGEAMKLEKKIKGRGISRYLNDISFSFAKQNRGVA